MEKKPPRFSFFICFFFLGKTLLHIYTGVCFIFSCRSIDSFGPAQYSTCFSRTTSDTQLDWMFSKFVLKAWILWVSGHTITGNKDPPLCCWVLFWELNVVY